MSAIEVDKKKRAANSPLAGNGKELKESDINSSPILKGFKEACSSSISVPSSVGTLPPASYASVASTSTSSATDVVIGKIPVENISDTSIFKTQKPEGAFRDEIVVEINTLDGEDYRGTVTTKEAIKTIFVEVMGFEREDLGSLTIGYSKGRIVTYKLLNQFNIDTLSSIENFEFKRESKNRKGESIVSVLGCRIRGIRRVREPTQILPQYADEGYRWIKIEGAEYRLDKEQIASWLEFWGTLASDITEDKIADDSDDSESGHMIGNGTYSVKMKLRSDLPQFLPMFGKRIRIYYRGIIKKCTNCFGAHARKACNQERVLWIQYVSDLMTANPEIPIDFYGKWAAYVNELRGKAEGPQQGKPDEECEKPMQNEAATAAAATKIIRTTANNPKPMGKGKHAVSDVAVRTEQQNQEVDAMLQRLRGQGLVVSTADLAKHKESFNRPLVDSKSEVKGASESGRGRGRRKASLN